MMQLKKPLQWGCSKCSWRDSTLMRSDVLLPRPQEQCPKCGAGLELKESGLISGIGDLLSKWTK